MSELNARIRAALRRAGGSSRSGQALLELGELRIDLERRAVSMSGRAVHLTPKEYDMLRYLVANAGKLITHRMLLRAVWGPSARMSASTCTSSWPSSAASSSRIQAIRASC
jgi:two-component system, OmpR family, KDP operon response regulator KdpE